MLGDMSEKGRTFCTACCRMFSLTERDIYEDGGYTLARCKNCGEEVPLTERDVELVAGRA